MTAPMSDSTRTNYCVDCGSRIPSNQRTCSMCYGDINHGTDGYYRQWAETQDERREDAEREAREGEGR